MDEFTIYSFGLCYASVCTSLSVEESTERINREFSTGIGSDWAKAEDEFFVSGETNPCPCNDHPETHQHYLFVC